MNMDVMRLIIEASLPVQIVMLLLLAASIASWRIILQKRGLIRKTKSASDDFETSFWSGGDLNTLYRSASRVKGGSTGMASIFEAGFREFNRLVQQGDISADKLVDECRRAMRVAQIREMERLELGLATLATVLDDDPPLRG